MKDLAAVKGRCHWRVKGTLSLSDLEVGIWVTLRNGQKVSVRRFRRADGEALYAFFTRGLSPVSQQLYSSQPLDWHLVNCVVSEADDPKVFRLVALSGTQIVGYAYWRERFFSTYPLLSIAVADDFQGLGLGHALMELLIEGARKRGKKGLELHVFKHNRRALSLYRKLGFQIVGDTDFGRQWVMVLQFEGSPRP